MINKIDTKIIDDLLAKCENDNIHKIVVGGVILNQKNEVLLLKRVSNDFMGDLIELPSGTVEENEMLLDALQREIKEETGLEIKEVSDYIGSFDYLSSSGKKTRQINFMIIVNEDNDIRLNGKEHSQYYWIKLNSEKINILNISPQTKNIIVSLKRKDMVFEKIVSTLNEFWSKEGCTIGYPYDMEKGAATLSPNTFLRALGKQPFSIAYLEPCRRPIDSRYAKDNTERYQWYYQYQVLMKPAVKNPKELFLKSLAVLGINDTTNKIEFIDDLCESPVFGAKFRGWEVWIDGMEIAQVSYLDEVGGIKCNPLSLEIAYGLERIALKIQKVNSFHEIKWNKNLTYGDLYKDSEIEQSIYNMETSSPEILKQLLAMYLEEAERQLSKSLVYPTMDYLLKASHTYNLLEANKKISKDKLDIFLKDIKNLSNQVGLLYIKKMDHKK